MSIPPRLPDPTSDAERWQRVEPLVARLLELSPERREERLATLCSGEPELKREVEGLLAACDQADELFERPAFDIALSAPEVSAASAEIEPGAIFGAYRILRPIDEGGMGRVYLAERADHAYRQRVAVKVLRTAAPSPAWHRRFQRERQILAQLDHPNIARLLDGGTGSGSPLSGEQPYLVMEHIEGQPIDVYCDARGLTIAQRLELFCKVCDAVRYAHRSLVVHRDIKPRNILVTGAGEPKLLDFGIAKLLDPASFDVTVEATAVGAQPMTPQYASPEQLRGQPTTTAVDVYALGLLLFELLAGCRPYRLGSLTPSEITRVLESPRVKPSKAVAEQPDAGSISARRSASTAALERSLSGDLDTIVSMALRPEPEHRYGSVEQLADDLRRHQTGLPIKARQDDLAYRSVKFLRRHRVAVTVAISIFSVLLVFALAMAHQASRIAEQAELLVRERDGAKLERAKAQEVADFMIDLFRVARPSESLGREVTARQLLDEGALRIENELHEQPLVQATLMDAIGDVYNYLQLTEDAKPLLERALKQRTRLLGDDHPDVATSLQHLGNHYRVAGNTTEAETHYHRALAIRTRVFGEDHLAVAETRDNLGVLLWSLGRLDEAEALLRHALEVRDTHLGSDHRRVGDTLNNLAIVLQRQGRYGEAAELLSRSLEIQLKRLPSNHPEVATAYNNIAFADWELGSLALAEERFRRALVIREEVLPPDHFLIALTLNNLGLVLADVGRFDEAADALKRSRTVWEQRENSAGSVATSWHNLATVYIDRGDRDRGDVANAEKILQRVVHTRQELYGPDSPWVATSLVALARCQRTLGQLDSAQQALLGSREIFERLPAEQRAGTWTQSYFAAIQLERGNIAAARGDEAEARAAWLSSVELVTPLSSQFRVTRHLNIHAQALIHLGRTEEALPMVQWLRDVGWSNRDFVELSKTLPSG
ncbi:MAG: serine/threonine-protein kinase [Acidobacteriota bacterium]